MFTPIFAFLFQSLPPWERTRAGIQKEVRQLESFGMETVVEMLHVRPAAPARKSVHGPPPRRVTDRESRFRSAVSYWAGSLCPFRIRTA
jgi:hypothetical protein